MCRLLIVYYLFAGLTSKFLCLFSSFFCFITKSFCLFTKGRWRRRRQIRGRRWRRTRTRNWGLIHKGTNIIKEVYIFNKCISSAKLKAIQFLICIAHTYLEVFTFGSWLLVLWYYLLNKYYAFVEVNKYLY